MNRDKDMHASDLIIPLSYKLLSTFCMPGSLLGDLVWNKSDHFSGKNVTVGSECTLSNQ